MKVQIDPELGLEFSSQAFIISSDDQKAKLECCDIEPNALGSISQHSNLAF